MGRHPITKGMDHGSCWRRSPHERSPRSSLRMAPLPLFNQSQGHRHNVPGLRPGGGGRRWNAVHWHADGTPAAWFANISQSPRLRCLHHCARPDHDLFHGDAGADRGVRQLDGAADDRGPRHGVPAHEQYLILAATGLVHPIADFVIHARRARHKRGRDRVDALCAVVD